MPEPVGQRSIVLLVWVRGPAGGRSSSRRTTPGGAPADTDQAFIGLVVNNEAAGKLDYYLHRSVDYQSTGCRLRPATCT